MKKNSDSFSEGQVIAQERYGTTAAALALIDNPYTASDTTRLWPGFREFIEARPFFFIATSRKSGACNCNFRGGGRGVLHVADDKTIYFPDYAGNGILHSIGDLIENPQIGILFIDFETQQRIKVNGTATIIDDRSEIQKFFHLPLFRPAQRIIRVHVDYAVPNCPRYLSTAREASPERF